MWILKMADHGGMRENVLDLNIWELRRESEPLKKGGPLEANTMNKLAKLRKCASRVCFASKKWHICGNEPTGQRHFHTWASLPPSSLPLSSPSLPSCHRRLSQGPTEEKDGIGEKNCIDCVFSLTGIDPIGFIIFSIIPAISEEKWLWNEFS